LTLDTFFDLREMSVEVLEVAPILVLRGIWGAGIKVSPRTPTTLKSARSRGNKRHAGGKPTSLVQRDLFNPIKSGSLLERELIMNKGEFVGAVADAADMTKADAERAVEAVFKVVKKALKSGDSISLVGFGTFSVRKRAARTGRNPRTGDTIKIKASKVPAFKAGKGLKDAIN